MALVRCNHVLRCAQLHQVGAHVETSRGTAYPIRRQRAALNCMPLMPCELCASHAGCLGPALPRLSMSLQTLLKRGPISNQGRPACILPSVDLSQPHLPLSSSVVYILNHYKPCVSNSSFWRAFVGTFHGAGCIREVQVPRQGMGTCA